MPGRGRSRERRHEALRTKPRERPTVPCGSRGRHDAVAALAKQDREVLTRAAASALRYLSRLNDGVAAPKEQR